MTCDIYLKFEFLSSQFKTKLNEMDPENDEDRIETPDVILSVQISHPLNSNIRVSNWITQKERLNFLSLGSFFSI